MKLLATAILAITCCLPSVAQVPVELVIDGRKYRLTLTPLDNGVGPIAPSDLTVDRDALGRVVIAWADKSIDEAAFVVWRRQDGGEWQRIGTTAANVSAYTDWGALPGTYTYRVQSTKDTGSSAFTSEVPITVALLTELEPLSPVVHAYTAPDGSPLTALEPGGTIAIRGESFGEEKGQILVNGLEVPSRLWTATTVTVRLPSGTLLHPPTVTVRRADGKWSSSMVTVTKVTP